MTNLWGVLLAYLLGSIPTGYLLVRIRRGIDVRRHGSGNIGATNVTRVAGLPEGVAVLVIDIAKGYFAVWLAGWIAGGFQAWMAAAAVAVMLGNAYPIFLDFRGGKAVATFVGAFLAVTPGPAVATIVVFLATLLGTRYISASSVVAGGTFPLAVWLIEQPEAPVVVASVLAAALIVWRHRENLRRLHAGTENTFSLPFRKGTKLSRPGGV